MAKASGLTAAKLNSNLAPGKYFDVGGLGLFIRVETKGSKFWIQRITIGGRRREIGLGSYPSVPIALAREAAQNNKSLVRAGQDPLAERIKPQKIPTFEEATTAYFEFKLTEFSNAKHRDQWRSTLRTYAFPHFGALTVDQITTDHIVAALQPIWASKTETASRVRQRIEAVLSWARVKGFRTGENPALWKSNLSEILPKPSKVATVTHQPALPVQDAQRWWAELKRRDGVGARGLQFAMICGSRSGELRQMAWDQVELYDEPKAVQLSYWGIWTIPATAMKAKREHRVVLPKYAAEVLQNLPRHPTSPLVFAASSGGMLSDMTLSQLMRRMHQTDMKEGRGGFIDQQSRKPAVPHGLRSTFRNWAAEKGYPSDIAEIQLAHKVGTAVERAYLRTDMIARRAAMVKDWINFLEAKEHD